jgi:hypothetical protein
VGQQVAPGDVAAGVQPAAKQVHRVVDLDVSAGLQPNSLQPQVGSIRRPTDRDQQLVAEQLAAVVEDHGDLTAPLHPPHPGDRPAGEHADPRLGEGGGQQLAVSVRCSGTTRRAAPAPACRNYTGTSLITRASGDN